MSVDDRTVMADTRLLGDRYRLGRLLGRGGTGRVYEALDVMLGRTVAVKIFHSDGAPVGRYRFATEARLLAGLSHPGLVTVYDVCLDDEPFLVMRLVDGTTLRNLLDRGPLDPTATARMGARLADVLAYVHGHGIVHRDIKPSNILLDDADDCLLTDFGLARALDSAHLTTTGEFVGTAAYLAPEQITDIDIPPAADVYALGLVLLECLTGHVEYTGTTLETAVARLHRPPRVPGTLPPPWHTLLTAMTAQDPALRPPAARCAEVLTTVAAGRTATLAPRPTISGPEPTSPRRRLPRPRPVHAGMTALALTAACAVALSTTATIPGTPTGEPRPAAPTSSTGPGAGGPSDTLPPTTANRGGPAPAEQTRATTEKPRKGKPGRNKDAGGAGKGKTQGRP